MDAAGGATFFYESSTASNGTFTNNGGTVSGAGGGLTQFNAFTSADNGKLTNNGGTAAGAQGGATIFAGNSAAANATLIANSGTNGGEGGAIIFADQSVLGAARISVFGNGSLDISLHSAPGMTINSIEGDGNVFLGANNLTVGSNNQSTNFAVAIQDGGQSGGTGGSLTKIGTSVLSLTGVNTYSGDTNIKQGTLKVDGSITSNTVVRQSATLAGTGVVGGNVTNNGKVNPGDPIGSLTVSGNYTQTRNATLLIDIAGTATGEFSLLNIIGNASLSGNLDPVLLGGFVPIIGESFTILDYASHAGAFSRIQNQVFDDRTKQWSITYQDNNAILTVGRNTIPDRGSTLLFLALSSLALVNYRRQLVR